LILHGFDFCCRLQSGRFAVTHQNSDHLYTGEDMKHRWLVLAALLGTLLASPFAQPAIPARAENGKAGEPFQGEALCLPGAYLSLPGDCLPLGPSQTLTDLAKKGLTFPPRPLPAAAPPSDLTKSPVLIARINIEATEPAQIYASLDDAVAGNNPVRQIAPGTGLRYVSYVQESRVNGKPFVQLKSGEWMRASPAGYSFFQGLLFQKTPANAFGWMVDHARARTQPNWNAPEVGETILRESVIQIYDVVVVDDMEWYMVGPDQWVPWQDARRVRIDTTPPQGITGDRWIMVDLYDQTLAVYDHRQLVFSTLIASGGEPFYTRPGLFKIFKKKPLETMSGAFEAGKTDYYYLEDVPWTMYFDQARALHGAYWRAWYGFPGTHGCVNLSIGDSAWLYQWANEGDPVYVWDPSGKTPTDPKLYSEGGA
jgi:lipoprotein-anchoring transpeptidase ErfK/SrfK